MADPSSEEIAEDRKQYYDKWHKFAKEEVDKAEEEAAVNKVEADKALGLHNAVRSEAEEKDKTKFAALKEAKKEWDQKKISEAAMKQEITGVVGADRTFDSVKLHWKPVVLFKDNKDSNITIPSDEKLKHRLVKVFIENCDNCTFHIGCSLVTHHLEISHCKNIKIYIKERLATVQIDVCDGVEVIYEGNFMHTHIRANEGVNEFHKLSTIEIKLFHAAVENLKISYPTYSLTHEFSYTKFLPEDEKLPKEVQFLTRYNPKTSEIETSKVVRDNGNLPATEEDLANRGLTPKDALRAASLKKTGGNEAFKEGNYAQAAIFYTEAIDVIENVLDLNSTDEESLKQVEIINSCDFYHVCLANRAFCWQKLGHHEKAERDGRVASIVCPSYAKAWFRLGLALHAQKNYLEAGKALSKAHDLEPKNEQIKQALGFAEVQLRKLRQV